MQSKEKYMCTLHKHLYFLLLDILTTRYLFGGPILSVDIRNETISFVLFWRKSAWFALIFLRMETHFFYLPQTKFAKVMFSQVSVCPQGGFCLWSQRGVSATHPRADTHTPVQTPPGPGRQPPWADTPWTVHAWIHTPPWAMHAGIHPCLVHAGIRSTSRRYASHWNAFLFCVCVWTRHLLWTTTNYMQLWICHYCVMK